MGSTGQLEGHMSTCSGYPEDVAFLLRTARVHWRRGPTVERSCRGHSAIDFVRARFNERNGKIGQYINAQLRRIINRPTPFATTEILQSSDNLLRTSGRRNVGGRWSKAYKDVPDTDRSSIRGMARCTHVGSYSKEKAQPIEKTSGRLRYIRIIHVVWIRRTIISSPDLRRSPSEFDYTIEPQVFEFVQFTNWQVVTRPRTSEQACRASQSGRYVSLRKTALSHDIVPTQIQISLKIISSHYFL